MTALEIAKAFVSERIGSAAPAQPPEGENLAARVRTILAAGERHTTRSLALRLGRPRDLELYAVLGALLEAKAIGTDGESCEFYRRDGR
jgi:hypothetical protein